MAQRAVAEEGARREHLVVYLSGAHAYGFPSPDSDLDLKCVHVAPTGEFLGFCRPPLAVDRAEVLDGVELDYTSHELGHVLDTRNTNSDARERYAIWFATEYGYRASRGRR